MNKLFKFAAAALVLAPALIASSAFAATISNPVFSNGDVTIDAKGGSTVSGTFQLQLNTGEVCEVLRTQSDPSQPFMDTQVGGTMGYQWGSQTSVPFSVKVPPNTGTYYPTVQCAGIWGGNHSVDGADGVVAGPTSLGTLRVTATGSTGTVNSSNIDDIIAALKAAGFTISAPGATTPAPVVNPKCAALATKMAAGAYGVTSSGNIALQGYLLSEGANIPALAAGASFGYWGPQTQAAIGWFKTVNSCN